MPGGASRVRTAGLLVTGAVAVHELRYLVAGAAADSGAGHGYLPVAGLLSTVLLGVAGAQLAAVVERARRTGSHEGSSANRGFLATWLAAAVSLTLIFFVQEVLEGLLAGARAADLGGVAAEGGWMALPASVVVGGLLALAIAGARSAVAAAAQGARRTMPRRRTRRRPGLARGHRPIGRPIARHLAGRAPPYAVS